MSAEFASQVEVAELWTCVRVLERDMLVQKIATEKELASREWVKELVDPIKENTAETRRAVEDQRKEMGIFFEAHTKVLQQNAERDQKEHEAKMKALESQTWSAILKDKWLPLLGFVGAGSLVVTILGQLLEAYLRFHGYSFK